MENNSSSSNDHHNSGRLRGESTKCIGPVLITESSSESASYLHKTSQNSKPASCNLESKFDQHSPSVKDFFYSTKPLINNDGLKVSKIYGDSLLTDLFKHDMEFPDPKRRKLHSIDNHSPSFTLPKSSELENPNFEYKGIAVIKFEFVCDYGASSTSTTIMLFRSTIKISNR